MSSSSSSTGAKKSRSREESLGVPFSLEFIRSQQQEIPPRKSARSSSDRGVDDIKHVLSNDGCKCLVQLDADMFIAGAADVMFIKGPPVYINGYRLQNRKERIVISSWMPAARIESCLVGDSAEIVNKRQPIAVLLKSYCLDFASDRVSDLDKYFGQSSSVLYVEGVCAKDLEWLVAAEGFSEKTHHLKHLRSLEGASNNNAIILESVVIAGQDGINSFSADVLTIPVGWKAAVDGLLRIRKGTENQRVVICGARGVGKSTCLRHALNRLLSRYKAVAVMDFDVGQPELSAPGFMSLHVVKEPLLSAGHLNMRPAELEYFIGDISTKSSPDLAIQAVRKLFAYYTVLKVNYAVSMPAVEKAASSNIYAMLAGDEEIDDTNDCILPLLVNTDGWVRYMGAEILKSVVSVVSPTHVFHVSSARGFDSIEALEPQNLLPECQLLHLEPGRSIPSKIAAAELRTLR